MSGQTVGSEIDIKAVNDAHVDSGVALGVELLAFTDAVMQGGAAAIANTRAAVHAEIGDAGVVDASAVIMMFNVVDRVADATGIPIDEEIAHDERYQIGSELGMDHLTPEERAAR